MEPDESTDPRVGGTIEDRYRILARLSSGAMGVVYRAERLRLGRQVAIKFLHAHFASVPDFSRRFQQEALAMSRLNHPHCVSVIDFGTADGPFIVMDFVTGKTLGDLVDGGPLAPARAIHILRQILAGLAHAHQHGIIHRDIKPANIMLSEATGTGDHVHILDFGLAKLWDADQSATGIVVGTPSYMSPEQAGIKKLDARSDVYSAGVVLFELLTGEKPFQSDETFELLRKHVEEPPPALRDRAPGAGFSTELEAVVARALAKTPDERYQSALEMSDALATVPEVGTGQHQINLRMGTDSTVLAVPPRSAPPAPDPRSASGASEPPASEPPASELSVPPAAATIAPPAAAPTPATSTAPPAYGGPAVEAEPETRTPRRRRRRRRRLGWLVAVAVIAAGGWIYAGAPGLSRHWRTKIRTGERAAKSKLDQLGRAVAAPSRKPARPRPATMKRARALIAAGKVDEALRVLSDLRRTHPRDGKVLVLLGDLYIDKGWWSEGLAAYRDAVIHKPAYRDRPHIVNNAVRALDRPKVADAAEAFLVRRIGAPALPALRRAAAKAKAAGLRRRCRRAIRQIEIRERARRGRSERNHR